MRIIGILSELINEELEDAENYAKLALEYKQDYPELADAFYVLSGEELKHMGVLHSHVTKLISQRSKTMPDPRTEGMKVAHQFIHERQIEKEKSVRTLQGMYKGTT